MTRQKKSVALLLILGLFLSALLAACGESATNTAVATTASTATTAASSATTAATSATTAAASATTAVAVPTTSAATSATTAAASGKADTVKMVHVPGLFFASLYAAMERGYFKEQNIEVSLERAAAGSDVMAFLAQGQIDVGAVGLSAASFNALNKGFDFKVVASAGIAPDANDPTLFVVRKALTDDGSVKKPGDLKGKKIAVAGGKGSAGAYLAAKAIATDGLTLNDVTLVNLANPDMVAGLKNGAIDAALIAPPFSTQAVSEGTATVLAKDWLPGYATTTFMYSGKFIKERPEVAKRFMVALLKGQRAVIAPTYLAPENVAAFVKWTGSTEQIVRETPPKIFDPNGVITKESIKDQEKIHRESGATDYKTALDVEKMFDTSFAENAVKVLGTAR
jgi:NitT/TauT family transport system substrate-binding protein